MLKHEVEFTSEVETASFVTGQLMKALQDKPHLWAKVHPAAHCRELYVGRRFGMEGIDVHHVSRRVAVDVKEDIYGDKWAKLRDDSAQVLADVKRFNKSVDDGVTDVLRIVNAEGIERSWVNERRESPQPKPVPERPKCGWFK